jgi:hypothetical protein
MATEAELILKLTDQTQAGFRAIQQSFQQLKAQAKDAEAGVGGLSGKLKEFGSGLVGGFGIGAGFLTVTGAAHMFTGGIRALQDVVTDAVAGLIQLGSQMADLSAKTGLSTDALQEMKFAGSQVGVSVESLTGAITQMQRRLVETPEAFAKLGLSARELIAMKPEQAFAAIAEKIKAIEEPARQTAAAMEVFGRSGATVLPVLKAGYSELANEAHNLGLVLDGDVLGSADRVDDALTKLQAIGEGFSNTLGALIVDNDAFAQTLDDLIVVLGGTLRFINENDEAFSLLAGTITDHLLPGLNAVREVLAHLSVQMEGLPAVTKKTGGFGIFGPMEGPDLGFEKILADGIRQAEKLAKAQEKIDLESKRAMVRAAREAAQQQKRAEQDLFQFRIQTYKLGQKASEEFFNEQERQASENAKKMLASLQEQKAALDDWHSFLVAAQQASDRAFAEMLDDLRGVADAVFDLGDAFGGTLGDVLQFGAGALNVLVNLNDEAVRNQSTIQKLGGAIQGAAAAFQSGSLLGGAAAGASAGAAFGPLGAGIGAVAGGLLGLFGGAKKAREELNKLKDQVIGSHGSLQNFAKAAAKAGVDVSKAFSTKDPKEFKRLVDEANEAMEAQQKRIEGVKTAMGGLELMTKGFAAQMERVGVASEFSQAQFTRLGNFAVASFAGLVRETGDVIGALQQMGGSLDQLVALQQEFGFAASGAFANLLSLRGVVVANEDVAMSISGLNQLMKGLGDAGLITTGILMDLGAQASANFDELINRGVPANQALSLMQPTLQELWEQQKRLGVTYDENTEKLLRQAEEQGLVGDQFLSTNEAMLEVLKILAETLGATLPEALRRMGDAAEHEFGRMGDAAHNAGGAIPGDFGGGGGASAPGFSREGFIPSHPPFGRHIRVSEDEGEFVLKSSTLARLMGSGGGSRTIILQVGARQLAKVVEGGSERGDLAPKSRIRRAG